MSREASDRYLLEVRNLKKYYPIRGGFFRRKIGDVKAVDDVTILRLTDPTDGEIFFQGKDITKIKGEELRKFRQDMQMVFQDPYASLNPKMMVGDIVSEPIRNFTHQSKKDLKDTVLELLEKVGLTSDSYYKYPHEFSGGQRQRIGIARALALKPKLIVGDEPVSALDVSVQSQVLNLMQDLQEEFKLTYLFIAHDLSVVEHMSDRIGVMYLGRLVELADKEQLYKEPLHPYTQALLSAIPVPDPRKRKERIILSGDVPSPANPPQGCAFHPRCQHMKPECSEIRPTMREVKPGHQVACHLYS
jgi:peptide/nickel transport system ATP-binding protein